MATEAEVEAIIADALPLMRRFASGRYAITLAGSRAKGAADGDSDIDFRLYCDAPAPDSQEKRDALSAFDAVTASWKSRGIEIDGCWVRTIAEIDRELDDWLAGVLTPPPIVWTVWGYYLPTDIHSLHVVEDPDGIARGWKERVRHYPPSLKRAVIERHRESLAYWREDYHYRNKVKRGDSVFLAGLCARLVHDLLQVVFALNETYFPGDGNNLHFTKCLAHKPERFEHRIEAALYPAPSSRMYEVQRDALIELIDDTDALVRTLAEES